MGIDVDSLRLLIETRNRFGPLGDVLQLGRQGLYILESPEVDRCIREAGLGSGLAEAIGPFAFADQQLLPRLGATRTVSVDASAYEGADIVHDFNEPIGADLHGKFDTVIDFGSTEHIFNVAQSWKNLLLLPRVGGRLIGCVPANNWFGHGFYQFSAELAFRVLVPDNGYRLHVVYYGALDGSPLDVVEDSGADGIRGEIGLTHRKASLLYIAERIENIVPFSRRWPQQGDYAATWRNSSVREELNA